MAWTTPKTWASGYVVLAADLNTHLRDNLLAIDGRYDISASLTDGGAVVGGGAGILRALAVLPNGSIHVGDGSTDPAVLALLTNSTGFVTHEKGGLEFNASAITTGGLLIGDSSGVMAILAAGTNGQHLIQTSGKPDWITAGGALTKIGTAVLTGQSSGTVEGLDSTYDTYLVLISDIVMAIDSNQVAIRLGDSGGIDTGSSDYQYSLHLHDTGGTHSITSSTGTSAIETAPGAGIGNVTNEGYGAVLWLVQPGDSGTLPKIEGTAVYENPSNVMSSSVIVGRRQAVITVDRILIKTAAGDFNSGRLTVYGVSHA